MSEIPKAYEPQSVEDKWYDFWLKQGCFTADPARVTDKRPAYSIVIPPPNVTGMLHMGHVLNNTIQDILSRKARMDGKEVLWLPGTDHAGIATQVQVEKALKKEEKKTKYDLGREEFLKRVWAWKEEKGGIIINQLKKLGCSCDWTRERFTMDPEYSRCVQKVFVELYKKGLIYRGKRMVNWCPATQTALSDEEVEMKPQKGFMYHFKVQVAEAPDTWLTIATTRPETIPGDTAVAVNPKDPRYAHLIGKHIVRPLPAELPREQKLIPIIAPMVLSWLAGRVLGGARGGSTGSSGSSGSSSGAATGGAAPAPSLPGGSSSGGPGSLEDMLKDVLGSATGGAAQGGSSGKAPSSGGIDAGSIIGDVLGGILGGGRR